ncbi:HPr family phosphocarrier protein [Microbacterium indicum]|uniref:HPr family phosphocarrier protein n=1 Tax=Microbacterium indicum TaxID=358100 RepID=UPI00040C21ED|nr:HPr family phosphocarrier protein [Microbacterium indicum]
MIGLVVVSHSAPLAEAAVDLARQMAPGDEPPVRIAAGADGGFGTDAAAIAAAYDELEGSDGVVVLTDLGSAMISAEFAVDLREGSVEIRISRGPLVEGLAAAIVRAAGGAGLDEVLAEADGALAAKAPAEDPAPAVAAGFQATARIADPLGLHARPAAGFAKAAASFDARVSITDVTKGAGPADAKSLIAILALGSAGGDEIRIDATGPEAEAAATRLAELLETP